MIKKKTKWGVNCKNVSKNEIYMKRSDYFMFRNSSRIFLDFPHVLVFFNEFFMFISSIKIF